MLAAYDRGMKTRQIAELFEVSSSWARLVKQRQRDTGETGPRPRGGATVIKIDLDRLAALVKQRPNATDLPPIYVPVVMRNNESRARLSAGTDEMMSRRWMG